ncbi:hypothetical protein M426DRAFT_325841, partial [Hypoxylon sp. CI-4A]
MIAWVAGLLVVALPVIMPLAFLLFQCAVVSSQSTCQPILSVPTNAKSSQTLLHPSHGFLTVIALLWQKLTANEDRPTRRSSHDARPSLAGI